MTTMMMMHQSGGSLRQVVGEHHQAGTLAIDQHQFGRAEQSAISSSSNFHTAEQQASSTSRPPSSASNQDEHHQLQRVLLSKQHQHQQHLIQQQQPTGQPTNDHFFAATKSGAGSSPSVQLPEQHQDLQDSALHYYGAKSFQLGPNYHYQTQAHLNRAFQQQQQHHQQQQQQQQQQQPVLSSSSGAGGAGQQFVHDYYQAEYANAQPAGANCHNAALPANALTGANYYAPSTATSGFHCEPAAQPAYTSPADYYQNYQHYQSLAESPAYLGTFYEQQYVAASAVAAASQSQPAAAAPHSADFAAHPLTPTQQLDRRGPPVQASSHARRLQRFAQLASSYQSCTASYPPPAPAAQAAAPATPQHHGRLVRPVTRLRPGERPQRGPPTEMGAAGGPPKIMSRRKNATRETTATLKAWLDENGHNPYPSKGEKMLLAMVTRMSQVQISTWFANARRRMKKENRAGWPAQRLQPGAASSAGPQVGAADGLAAMRSFLCRYQKRLAAEGKSPALLAQISGGLQLHGFSLVGGAGADNKSLACTRLHPLAPLAKPKQAACERAPSAASSSGGRSSASDRSASSPRGEPSSTTGNYDRIAQS